MSKRVFKDLQPQSAGPHHDYEKNLSIARVFCQKVQKSLPKGMTAKVADSEGIKEGILMISFNPPAKARMGNFAASVCLHQPSKEASQQTEAIFNTYRSMAEKFWKQHKNEEQADFF